MTLKTRIILLSVLLIVVVGVGYFYYRYIQSKRNVSEEIIKTPYHLFSEKDNGTTQPIKVGAKVIISLQYPTLTKEAVTTISAGVLSDATVEPYEKDLLISYDVLQQGNAVVTVKDDSGKEVFSITLNAQ